MTEADENEDGDLESAQQAREEKMVGEVLDKLSEHFDSVRIFVTSRCEKEPTNWNCYSEGRGNYYAQRGQIEDWIVREQERTRINERE
jgi:hypothetical protein